MSMTFRRLMTLIFSLSTVSALTACGDGKERSRPATPPPPVAPPPPATPSGQLVTEAEYGDEWPFTVSQGYVDCRPVQVAVFRTSGTTYARPRRGLRVKPGAGAAEPKRRGVSPGSDDAPQFPALKGRNPETRDQQKTMTHAKRSNQSPRKARNHRTISSSGSSSLLDQRSPGIIVRFHHQDQEHTDEKMEIAG